MSLSVNWLTLPLSSWATSSNGSGILCSPAPAAVAFQAPCAERAPQDTGGAGLSLRRREAHSNGGAESSSHAVCEKMCWGKTAEGARHFVVSMVQVKCDRRGDTCIQGAPSESERRENAAKGRRCERT